MVKWRSLRVQWWLIRFQSRQIYGRVWSRTNTAPGSHPESARGWRRRRGARWVRKQESGVWGQGRRQRRRDLRRTGHKGIHVTFFFVIFIIIFVRFWNGKGIIRTRVFLIYFFACFSVFFNLVLLFLCFLLLETLVFFSLRGWLIGFQVVFPSSAIPGLIFFRLD